MRISILPPLEGGLLLRAFHISQFRKEKTYELQYSVVIVVAKDVMFAAELKRAFAKVLKSKQEGQGALERASGESAALRNLANAAKLLESNPALLNLRLMQSLSAAQTAGNTLVLGVPGFVPLKNGRCSSAPEAPVSDCIFFPRVLFWSFSRYPRPPGA